MGVIPCGFDSRPRHLVAESFGPALSRDDSELVDAILHAMQVIGREIELLVTMHCNCAVHRPGLVDQCIEKLLGDPEADSCVSGTTMRSVHPFRTRRLAPDGTCILGWTLLLRLLQIVKAWKGVSCSTVRPGSCG